LQHLRFELGERPGSLRPLPPVRFADERFALALVETFGVWLVCGLVGVATVVTYARIEPEELYHTSVGGLAGGLGRALVFLNYPVALVAIATLAVSLDRLDARLPWLLVAAVAVVLCAIVAVPGVVDQDDLDAKPVNALPAAGVALAFALSLLALRRGGLGRLGPRLRGDAARVTLGAVLIAAAIPWIFAELGFYAPLPFLADEIRPEPDEPALRAVHLGRHHGMDGTLLALTALALSRTLPRLRHAWLRLALAAYLSLTLVYGLANAAQDFWLEQVVKRDWTEERLPTVIRPSLSVEWAVLVAAAAVVYTGWLMLRRAASQPSEDR
jgi:hypothetical protein